MFLKKIFLFLVLFKFSFAFANSNCSLNLGLEMANEARRLNDRYTEIEGGLAINNGNNAGLYVGNNDVGILLVHGFTASPFEVNALGRALNEQGFTVYLPLIQGFGANSAVANKFTYRDWRASLDASVESLARCYSKIIIIGFSNGGGLVTDYLLRTKDPRVAGLVAISPYYKAKVPGARILNGFMDIFTDSISYKTTYALTKHPDLVAMQLYPEHYTEGAPTKAVDSILDFGKELQGNNVSEKINTPTLLIYSESDKTINGDFAAKYLDARFSNIETMVFSKDAQVNHHVLLPISNNTPEIAIRRVIDFAAGFGK